LPGFLSTHPLTKDRIQKVRFMLAATDRTLARNERIYLQKMPGLVYGDDPRQGYVEGQAFYHPRLAFTFSVPDGWTVKNTPTQVVLVSKDEKAALLLQAEKNADPLPDCAHKKGETIKGGRLVSEDQLSVAGFSSFHQIYDVSEQNGSLLRLRLSLIQKGELVYSFSALSSAQDFNSYDPLFKQTIQSFAELRDPRYLERKPLRLHLIEADGRRTLQETFVRAGMKKELCPNFAIMNGMELDEVPAAGRLIKVAF
jgi:predicted Zn-dependent protease